MLTLILLLSCRDKATDTDDTGTSETGTPDDTADTTPADFACSYVDPPDHGDEGTVAITVTEVASGLFTPWGLAWMPDGDMLLTERDGVISRVTPGGVVTQLALVPSIESGEGGLLGLALDPDFATSRAFFIYYTASDGGTVNRVARWVLSTDGTSASADAIIVDDIPARQYHNGGRLRIGPDDKLYIGTGDAGDPDASQDTADLAGKVLRVNLDGSIPDDNPYPGEATWIWGVRNTQGFDWVDGETMVVSDHGPSGLSNEGGRSDHDEVTLASAGENLGWPEIYACEEGDGFNTASITWGNALPPGGLAIYTGDEIPEWSGDVIIGVLGFDDDTPQLHRLRLDAVGNVTINEVYLNGDYGRLRETVMGPDGGLYVTTSNCDGRGTCGDGDLILRIGG
ncbi:MAG: glucose/arabinose dehydrogenase [Myxococcota bacterium]|jgi:glucose/arabinose dehydrogenase